MTLPSQARPTILVVDDHPPNLMAMRRLLRSVDADIVEATSGNEALALALEHEFALVLLDVKMPDMDGFEIADLLKGEERTKDTPVIFMTAEYRDDLHRLRGYEVGGADFIEKPIDDAILLSKVRVFLDIYSSRRNLEKANADLSREIAERRRAEETLRDREAFFRDVLEHQTDLIHRFRPDTTMVYVNPAFAAFMGMAAEELVGQRWDEMLPAQERDSVLAPFRDVTPEHAISVQENAVPLRDGTVRWVRWTNRAFFAEDGTVSHFQSTGRDITEQREAEAALRESEEKYRKLFNNAIDAVCIFDLETHRLLDINAAYTRMYGYSREEALELTTEDISAEPESTKEAIEHSEEVGDVLVPLRNHRKKDGTVFQVELSAGPFTWKGRQVMFAIARDVTERNRLREQLERERDNLRNILSSMDDGVYIVNQAYEIQYINPVIERAFGPIDGRKCYAYFHDREEVCPWCLNQQVFRGESVHWEWHSNKTGRDYDLFDTPLVNPDGSISKLEFFHDITERKAVEDNLRRSNRDLQQFAYAASHDLNEPLNLIAGYIHLLADRYREKLDEEGDEFIGYVEEGAERMKALVRDILAFSRVETKGRPFEATEIGGVVDEAIANIRHRIEEHVATVTRDALPLGYGDRTQLVSLFQNLIGNAVKFRKKDTQPQVHVGIENQGGKTVFFVRDNGIGIEAKQFEKIFEIFQRLNPRHEYPGTGIGLALCQRIVERHGGRIWVESTPGEGSTFLFTLPVVKSDAVS